MNIRHAYSKEGVRRSFTPSTSVVTEKPVDDYPSPDERQLWGSLVDDNDALQLLRMGYWSGVEEAEAELRPAFEAAYAEGYEEARKDAA